MHHFPEEVVRDQPPNQQDFETIQNNGNILIVQFNKLYQSWSNFFIRPEKVATANSHIDSFFIIYHFGSFQCK